MKLRRTGCFLLAGSVIFATVRLVACAPRSHSHRHRQEPIPAPPRFSDDDRERIRRFWSEPGRYQVTSLPRRDERTNITVAGSIWEKSFATQPANPEWNDWLSRRTAFDKATAGGDLNTEDPGAPPDSLTTTVGTPPPLFERVRPKKYVIRFDDDAVAYTDNIPFGDRYAYYRFANGVRQEGKPIRKYTGRARVQINALFAQATSNASEKRVMLAVSELEGGFEAVNTYDTGYISVGFIQFIAGRDGDGSLMAVLQRERIDDGAAYERDFRRYGIDVNASGILDVVEPHTGQELTGADAVQAVIDDKRLTAVFERAGGTTSFRRAQIKTARERYWPGKDTVSIVSNTVYEQGALDKMPVVVGMYLGDVPPEIQAALDRAGERQATDPAYRIWTEGKTQTATVSALIHSEAGMATLMDRKVHIGNIRLFTTAVANLMQQKHLTRLTDISRYERQLIRAVKHRTDFLQDPSLTQPR